VIRVVVDRLPDGLGHSSDLVGLVDATAAS
jgi:hypothetical protein